MTFTDFPIKPAPVHPMPRPALSIPWHLQPWSEKNNAALAQALGCCESTVAKYRAIHAPGTEAPRGRPQVFDLSAANFTLHDDTIALVWGCSSDVVSKWRKTHDVPACKSGRRYSPGRPPKYNTSLLDPSKDAAWNAARIGCSYQHAWQLLQNQKQ